MTLSEVWLTTYTQKQSLISAAGLCQHHLTKCWSTIHGVHLWSTWRPGVRTKPLHGLGVRRHSRHRPGLPMRQSCSDGQYTCPDCLWPSAALCPGCWPGAHTQARPHSAKRTRQPSNAVTVSTAGRLQPDIGAGYHHSRQDTLSYTCPQVTLTLSPVPPIFPAAANKWSYWVRPYSDCYATMSSPPTVRPPRPLCCLLWLCSYLSCFWSTPNTHSQVWLSGYLIHPWSTPITPPHPPPPPPPPPPTHPPPPTPLPAVVTSRIPGKCPPCTPFCQLWLRRFSPIVWLCGYLTHPWSTPTTPTSLPAVATWLSRLSLEYAHHAQPGVAIWLSHPSLEYAHHAHLSASCGYVAISFIPGVRTPRPARCGYVAISPVPGVRPPRPPLCQLWLRGYLAHPWSTPTTPTYLPLPAVAMWLSHLSLEYAHNAQPGVAMSPIPEVRPPCPPLRLCQLWLSHLFPDHAHHAHPSVSCGYVASHQSLRTPRPARCGYVAISPVPGVRPPRPPLCQLWLRGYLARPWSTPTTPTSLPLPAVATWLSHLSLEYAHNAQPGVAMWLSHPSPKYAHHAHLSASASCGSLTYPRIMPTTPTLLPAVATWLLINPWSTYTTPSQVCLSHLSLEYAHHAHPLPAVATWLSHLSLEQTHHARSSTSCGYATNPWSTSNAPSHLSGVAMRLSPVSIEYARRAHPLSAAATQLSHLSLKYTHPTASCGYTTSHLALEYAHHAQPAAGVVAMWPSHFSPGGIKWLASLPPEYALHTQPFRQLWLPYPLPRPFPNLKYN